MPKAKGKNRRRKFGYNVNRKRLYRQSRKRAAPRIECSHIRHAWDRTKSVSQNLAEMGLAVDPNKAIPIRKRHPVMEMEVDGQDKGKRVVKKPYVLDARAYLECCLFMTTLPPALRSKHWSWPLSQWDRHTSRVSWSMRPVSRRKSQRHSPETLLTMCSTWYGTMARTIRPWLVMRRTTTRTRPSRSRGRSVCISASTQRSSRLSLHPCSRSRWTSSDCSHPALLDPPAAVGPMLPLPRQPRED
ncbi:nucleolar protein 16 isoform X1 [Gopherus evgoodei]|uniref:Nucleolar protein 16 n=1 Tax=Gopherus evgoodei TaxID=1825980 RepID=A0A8C4W2C9_9SAUR|nr:nucleolar protein 16 isoform X1 [Gopherus evgoodei]